MRQLLIILALFTAACGDLPLDGLKGEGNDDKKDDAGKDGPQGEPNPHPDCFGLDAALTCSKVDPNPRTADGCKWIVAESFPEQVSGDCRVQATADGKAVFELPVKPNAATLVVKKGDAKLDAANVKVVDGEKAKLEVTGVGASDALNISYTGAGNVTPPDTTPKGFLGTVEDATGLDGCKWLIKLENGTRLEPIGLEAAYQKAGLKVRIEYTPPETDVASICMAGQLVKVTKIEVVESGAGLKSCEDARTAFKKVTDELTAAPKACLADADCVSFGYDPTSGCPRHLFTAKTSFDAKAAQHTAAVDALKAQCPAPEVMCASFAASKPHCDGATKQCRGTH